MENQNLGLSDGDDLAPNSALAVNDLAGDVDLERCDARAHNLLVLAAAGPRPLDDRRPRNLYLRRAKSYGRG